MGEHFITDSLLVLKNGGRRQLYPLPFRFRAYETSVINRADKEAQNTDSVDGLAIRAQQWQ